MKAPSKSRTRFVPRVVYRTAFVGVVPLCVASASACGSSSSSGKNVPPSVACAGFGCGAVGVAAFADAGDAPLNSVACIGFDGAPCEAVTGDAATEGATDAAATDGNERDSPILAVACLGFCGVAQVGFGDGGDSG